MVEFAGVPYIEIIKLPLFLPFFIFLAFGLWSILKRKKWSNWFTERRNSPKKEVLKGLYLLTPIIAIIVFMDMGFSISRAALLGIALTVVVSLFRRIQELPFQNC